MMMIMIKMMIVMACGDRLPAEDDTDKFARTCFTPPLYSSSDITTTNTHTRFF